mgnify:CR=1 FL=1
MSSGKIIGLDIGTRRIGIAITDESGAICFPRTTVMADTEKVLLSRIVQYISQEKVLMVVVGLPLGEDNELTKSALRIQSFCQKLTAVLPSIHLTYVDEFGSTREAQANIPLKKHRKEKGRDDTQAALIILQRYVTGIGRL